jgi:hypothetical protein
VKDVIELIMIFGDEAKVYVELTKNRKDRYSVNLVLDNRDFGNSNVFGDLFELSLTMKRFIDNRSDFENDIPSSMSSLDFFEWLCGAGTSEMNASDTYNELLKRQKHALKFGRSLMHYSIFCLLENDILRVNFYNIKTKKIIETFIEYKYVLMMAKEFDKWSESLTGSERKILDWSQ